MNYPNLPPDEPAPALSEIDRRIIRELCIDGRISNAKLAEKVGLSATPCWNRVQALERAGVIKGYTAVVSQRAIGLPETVLIEIQLEHHDDETLDRLSKALADLPDVVEAHFVSGRFDILLKVLVSGTEGYYQFLRTKLFKLPGVSHTQSVFAIRCIKSGSPVV